MLMILLLFIMMPTIWPAWLEQGDLDEENFKQTVQSYLGLLSHCNAYDLSIAMENNFGIK